jgi:hypothetical protein
MIEREVHRSAPSQAQTFGKFLHGDPRFERCTRQYPSKHAAIYRSRKITISRMPMQDSSSVQQPKLRGERRVDVLQPVSNLEICAELD